VFVERWDLATGKMLTRANGGTDDSPPKLISYADGVMVLGSGPEVRDAVTGTTVVKLTVPEGQSDDIRWATAAALSPDGRVLAIGDGWTNKVWLFEMRTGKHRQILFPDGRYRNALHFLPDDPMADSSPRATRPSCGRLDCTRRPTRPTTSQPYGPH
jgi:hypothetical protein